jgi:hypothetical protein
MYSSLAGNACTVCVCIYVYIPVVRQREACVPAFTVALQVTFGWQHTRTCTSTIHMQTTQHTQNLLFLSDCCVLQLLACDVSMDIVFG